MTDLSDADLLEQLAHRELTAVTSFVNSLAGEEPRTLLIEACRCVDYTYVAQHLAANGAGRFSHPDFDILARGASVLLSLLLERMDQSPGGVPLVESTRQRRDAMISVLHAAGRYVVLSGAAKMLQQGMVSARRESQIIELACSERTLLDHFNDQIDHNDLAQATQKMHRNALPEIEGMPSANEVREQMRALTFPWVTSRGRMIGYTTTPEIDAFFAQAVIADVMQWRDEAGISPDADLGGFDGALLTNMVLALVSAKLKHIIFVDEGARRHADTNYHMSLTIWKTEQELLDDMLYVTGASEEEVRAALNWIVVGREDAVHYAREHLPGLPILIQLRPGFVLSPVTGVFRNPLHPIRMRMERRVPSLRNAFSKHREVWMREDLYGLFQGNRFHRVDGQMRLRRNGKTVTDIDAALFDVVTGDLALIQLKWQDFSTTNVNSQVSKARNFVAQVEDWGERVTDWIDEVGVDELRRALRIPKTWRSGHIRLIAVGRSAARLSSYGHAVSDAVLVLSWAQLVRLRYSIGPGQDFFDMLTRAVVMEKSKPPARIATPHKLPCGEWTVHFKDIWGGYEDGEQEPSSVE